MVFLLASCGPATFFFSFLAFEFLFLLLAPLTKDPPKTGHSKNPKSKMQKKKDKHQLAQLCSQIVFLDFLGSDSKLGLAVFPLASHRASWRWLRAAGARRLLSARTSTGLKVV